MFWKVDASEIQLKGFIEHMGCHAKRKFSEVVFKTWRGSSDSLNASFPIYGIDDLTKTWHDSYWVSEIRGSVADEGTPSKIKLDWSSKNRTIVFRCHIPALLTKPYKALVKLLKTLYSCPRDFLGCLTEIYAGSSEALQTKHGVCVFKYGIPHSTIHLDELSFIFHHGYCTYKPVLRFFTGVSIALRACAFRSKILSATAWLGQRRQACSGAGSAPFDGLGSFLP